MTKEELKAAFKLLAWNDLSTAADKLGLSMPQIKKLSSGAAPVTKRVEQQLETFVKLDKIRTELNNIIN